MTYFDWTATTPITQSSLDEYSRVSKDIFGNPSSNHPIGLIAKEELEKCRFKIADCLKVNAKDIFFTSGGTESDSIVIQSFLNSPSSGEILVSGIEHSAVLENKRIMEKFGWKFTVLPCPNGFLQEETLNNALNPNVRLVCIMKVNNVTGSILDTQKLVKTVRDYEKTNGRKIHIHCDAVQALGKIPFHPAEEGLDSCAFSSHKIGGPKGVGLLFNSNQAILGLSKGGGQEKGIRPGTENLPSISAMTKALEEALSDLDSNLKTVSEYHDILVNTAKENKIKILSPLDGSYSPYILSLSVKPIPSEVFLRVMSDKGFCLSAGSACSTNSRGKAESVLTAMKFSSEDRMSAIRISLSYRNTKEQIMQLAEELKNTYRMLTNAK